MKFKTTRGVGRNLTNIKLALLENMFGSAPVVLGYLVGNPLIASKEVEVSPLMKLTMKLRQPSVIS
jgi:hypothetical protein